MNRIIIVGAGGFGREVYGYAEDCIAAGAPWQMGGFLDDNPGALEGLDYPHGILGRIADYAPQPDDRFILGLGLTKAKKNAAEMLSARGAVFETLVHPTAIVGRNVRMGKGCILCPYASVTCDAVLGDFVTFNLYSNCGHDSVVGSWTTLSAHCNITGRCQVGEGVFFASGARMIPSAKVGDWATVGINSCVVMNIKPGISAFGNPAVKIK